VPPSSGLFTCRDGVISRDDFSHQHHCANFNLRKCFLFFLLFSFLSFAFPFSLFQNFYFRLCHSLLFSCLLVVFVTFLSVYPFTVFRFSFQNSSLNFVLCKEPHAEWLWTLSYEFFAPTYLLACVMHRCNCCAPICQNWVKTNSTK